MTKILTVVGARPQFIKAATVSRALKKKGINEILIHTGQHFDKNMSEIFFKEMMIPEPDYNLNISGLSHGAMTGRMIEGIESIVMQENPTAVMVYGDTNSTLAGALAASKLHIPVIHVEAGLRSFNMNMPEEINRILTDRVSSVLFCPTDTAISNLKKEGYDELSCIQVKSGDVMQDAAMFFSTVSGEKSDIINRLKLNKDEFVLTTIHRQENTDDRDKLNSIIRALNKIHKQKKVILPLHPRTKKLLEEYRINTDFTTIPPASYFDMIELLKNCSLVLTDSGGLQKEAFFFQKHCVTIREETEWVELVKNGFNYIAGNDQSGIIEGFEKMINKKSDFSIDLYGNGKASELISETIYNNFC